MKRGLLRSSGCHAEGGHVADVTAIKESIHRNVEQLFHEGRLSTLVQMNLSDLEAASEECKEVLLEMLKRSRDSDVEITGVLEGLGISNSNNNYRSVDAKSIQVSTGLWHPFYIVKRDEEQRFLESYREAKESYSYRRSRISKSRSKKSKKHSSSTSSSSSTAASSIATPEDEYAVVEKDSASTLTLTTRHRSPRTSSQTLREECMVYYETIQQLRNKVRALHEEVNAVSSQKNEQDENLEKLREEHINLMSQMSGAKISKGKLEKKVREETNEVDKEIGVDCPYAEVGRNVIVMLKHVKRVLEEFNARNGPTSRRSTHEVERVEGLRKFYNQLLMAVVSIGKGKGVRNSSASLLQRELGYKSRSSNLNRAIVRRMEAFSVAVNGIHFAEKVLPEYRRKKKNALSEKDIEIITAGFEECSEVSPNANDLVRRMKLVPDGTDSRFDVHQVLS